MKRFLYSLGILTVICSLALGTLGVPARVSPPVPLDDAFPTGQMREVEFDVDGDALANLSAREQIDQLRDWMLFTLVSSTGLPAGDVSNITLDLPAFRHAYLQPVARFECGPTRSVYVGDGTVLALIPTGDARLQSDWLAQIADEHRKNLGDKPRQIIPFEYRLDFASMGSDHFAEVTRQQSIEGGDLFNEQAGYYERTVIGQTDLDEFLKRVDTVSYASVASGKLVLGGRKFQEQRNLGVTLEDVAAIWQSQQDVNGKQARRAAFERRIKAFQAKRQNYLKGNRYSNGPDIFGIVMAEGEQLQSELKELVAERRRLSREGVLVDGSGFSLDPTYDFAGLKQYFDILFAPRFTRVLSSGLRNGDGQGALEIKNVSDALANEDEAPLLELLRGISKSKLQSRRMLAEFQVPPEVFLQAIQSEFAFQKARYDGNLNGTAVGMTLFYTDLLAKLWLSDRFHSTPSRNVDDFVSQLDISVSAVYKDEILGNRANTRLWFGPRDNGFQTADNSKSLLLAPKSVRVYAKGSNSLDPSKESEPNAVASSFLGWWNSHYDEVARYEPQYQHLNEILKWSLLISWLNSETKTDALTFLSPLKVYRENWFPTWANSQPDLRFKMWGDDCPSSMRDLDTEKFGQICFYPPGHKGVAREALPLLRSRDEHRFDRTRYYLGGVSLAERSLFDLRRSLSSLKQLPKLLRVSNARSYLPGRVRSVLQKLDGTSYNIMRDSSGHASVAAKAPVGRRIGSLTGFIEGSPEVNQGITRTASGLAIDTKTGNVAMGHLDVARTETGFRVGYEARSLDRAQSLARAMSGSSQPEAAIIANARVESYATLPKSGFAVRFKESNQWVRIESKGGPAVARTRARVADMGTDARTYDVTWLKPGEIPHDAKMIRPPKPTPVQGGIGSVRDSLLSKRYDDAITEATALIEKNGPSSEVRTLRGLARIGSRSNEVGDALNAALKGGARDSRAILDEVKLRLAENARANRGNGPTIVADSHRVLLGYKLSNLTKIESVSPDSIGQHSIVFVHDSLSGLNSLDWEVNTLSALQQAVDLRVAQVYKVAGLNIRDLRPSMLIPDPPDVVGGSGLLQRGPYRAHYPRALWLHVCPGNDDDRKKHDGSEKDNDCVTNVYVVGPRSH